VKITISPTNRPPRTSDVELGQRTIGRADDCDIVITDQRVSARHARLDVSPTGCWVTDLGSTNGTFVNGDRVVGTVWADAAAEVRVGNVVVRLAATSPTEPVPVIDHAATPPVTPAASYRVSDAGPVAGHDVRMDGQQVAGRDLHYHEGWTLKSRMRRSAKNLIRLGCLLFLAGMGLFGYFVISYNTQLFDAFEDASLESGPPELLSPMPWLPAGAGSAFLGIVLVVAGLLVPRDKVMTPPRDGSRSR